MKILVLNGSPKKEKSDVMHLTRAFLEGMNEISPQEITTVHLIIGRDQITLDKDGITITDWASEGEPVPGEVFKPQNLK